MLRVGVPGKKTTNRDDSRFYDERINGFSNYGVKILFDLVKILQIAFFDTLYFLNYAV